MSTNKSLVFISHINEEKEIAIAFKDLIESSFLGMLEVFVSSDENSIQMGQKWLDQISTGLKNCVVEIVLCSKKSITRPWINFEAGAGWVRDISVIPLCHSGIEPSDLPMPLNLLQAAKANEVSSLKLIFPVLASAIGAKVPNVDFSTFIEKVIDFEVRYTFWDECNNSFMKINNLNQSIIKILKEGQSINIELSEIEINNLLAATEFLEKNDILKLTRLGRVNIGTQGVTNSCALTPLARLGAIFKDPHFKY